MTLLSVKDSLWYKTAFSLRNSQSVKCHCSNTDLQVTEVDATPGFDEKTLKFHPHVYGFELKRDRKKYRMCCSSSIKRCFPNSNLHFKSIDRPVVSGLFRIIFYSNDSIFLSQFLSWAEKSNIQILQQNQQNQQQIYVINTMNSKFNCLNLHYSVQNLIPIDEKDVVPCMPETNCL